MKTILTAAAIVGLMTTTAIANPLLAGTAATSIAGAVSGSESGATAFGGTGGNGYGGNSESFSKGGNAGADSTSSTGGVTNKTGDSTTVAAALGQAPSGFDGDCGEEVRLLFGSMQWGQFSDKCFDRHETMNSVNHTYKIAELIAAAATTTTDPVRQNQLFELVNTWVERAESLRGQSK